MKKRYIFLVCIIVLILIITIFWSMPTIHHHIRCDDPFLFSVHGECVPIYDFIRLVNEMWQERIDYYPFETPDEEIWMSDEGFIPRPYNYTQNDATEECVKNNLEYMDHPDNPGEKIMNLDSIKDKCY